jgi:hypothetical protein
MAVDADAILTLAHLPKNGAGRLGRALLNSPPDPTEATVSAAKT